ncbi:MAG: CPBP family intramembrane metalloprotease [Planctomycetes bacterium]|nr:CPBP family intramembrane metalloprotease [Planctomycetota bacterium]
MLSVIAIGTSVAKGNEELQTVEAPLFDFATLLLAIFAISVVFWFKQSKIHTLPRHSQLLFGVTPTMLALMCFAMFVLGGIGAWFGSGRGTQGTLSETAWMYSSSIIAQLPIVILYAKYSLKLRSRRVIPISCIAFVVFVPLALSVAALSHAALVTTGMELHTSLGHETLKQLIDAPMGVQTWVVIVCVTVGAGIIEEVFYRGLLLPLFSEVFGGKTVWRAIIATSVFFAIMHIGVAQPSAILGLFVLSIGLCWARVKSGGVLSPIVIHIVFNAMNIAFVYSTHL